MNAQIARAALQQLRADRIRHAADADLQTGAVLDLVGDEFTHRNVHFRGRRIRQFGRGLIIALDDIIDLADMQPIGLAEHIGQAIRHLDDDHFRALGDGPVPEIGGAEIEIAVFIHAACLEDDHIHRRHETSVIIGDLAEIHWNVMGAAGVVLLAVVAGKMGAEPVKMFALWITFEHGARAHGNTGADFDVAQVIPARRQGLVENIGLAKGNAIVDPHAGSDEVGGLFG